MMDGEKTFYFIFFFFFDKDFAMGQKANFCRSGGLQPAIAIAF